jgi:predicted Zn-dependent protease
MRRRDLLLAGCAHCAGWPLAHASVEEPWQVPGRFQKPDLSSDEGGLWALMDREEARLRRSPFAIRDLALRDYLSTVTTRLVPQHAQDVRVYPVRTPMFNASMAPNGMMQVWTGLLLRVENEAQLAAVLGHEMGHYLQRHSIEAMRSLKDRSALNVFMSMFGVTGLIGQVINNASMFGFSRDQERQADRIGLTLMRGAGYDTREASKVWQNLQKELDAAHGGDPGKQSVLFATHPSSSERMETLSALSAKDAAGELGVTAFRERVAPMRSMLVEDELKRGQHGETIALMSRLMRLEPGEGWYVHAHAEALRLRGEGDDHEQALAGFQKAISKNIAPAVSYRGLGYLHRHREQHDKAKEAFARYVELAPAAGDINLIKTYLEEKTP